MRKRLCFFLTLLFCAAIANPAAAQVLTPVSGGLLDLGSSFLDTIDNDPGEQTVELQFIGCCLQPPSQPPLASFRPISGGC